MRSRLTQFFLILAATLSMLASTVSACTCSHHEVEAEKVPSCHASHDEITESASDAQPDAFDEGCVCLNNSVSPYLIGNAGQRIAKLEKQTAATGLDFVFASRFREVDLKAVVPGRSESPIFLAAITPRAPSRAPPRL
ncbi:MAG: hypothetical protein ACKVQJ_05840 [Pyrinomonadaceae bacterium]